jgi:hypothetical protein
MIGALSVVDRRRALRDALTALSARQIAWFVFLLTLLIYWSLVPWVSRHWWLTGDEPHYLIVTHSLLTDRDLDLSNNYQEKDFTLFYVGSELDKHVQIGPDGGEYPAHTIGLSLALVPAYALGYLVFIGHAGVLYFLASMGALLTANVYLLCYEVTHRKFSSLLAWATTAFTVPVMHYAYQVYPEIMAALLLVWSLRHVRRGGQTKPHVWLMVGICIGFLPWLASRFILLSAFLGAVSLFSIAVGNAEARHQRLRIIALCLPVVLLGGLLVAFNARLYGSVLPSGGTRDASQLKASLVHTSLEKLARGLVGWTLDQNRGLLIYTPLYVIALPGLLLLLRDRTRAAIFLALPVAATYLFLGWQGFWMDWGIPVRYLVSVLPLLGVPIVYGVQRIQSRSFIGLGLALFVVSVTTGMLLMRDPELVYAYRLHGRSGLLKAYERWLHVDISQYVPSFATLDGVIYAHQRAPGEIGEMVTDPQAERRDSNMPSTGSVIWAERRTQDAGYALDRVWPSRQYVPASSAGAYSACFRMRAGVAESPESTLAVVEVSTSQGVTAHKEITRAELPEASYGVSCVPFYYPGHQPLRVRVLFADQADLWIDWVKITCTAEPGTWILSGFWLALAVAFTTYYYLRYHNKAGRCYEGIPTGQLNDGSRAAHSAFALLTKLLIALTVFVMLASNLYLLFAPRTFEAEGLPHLVGEVAADSEASGGQAAYASRDLENNALVHGPYEFFSPGEYVARFRMKASGASATVEMAAIDVYGTASGVLAQENLKSDDFTEVERYQEFRLSFSNPASQALQYRVWYKGTADLWVDKIIVQRGGTGRH